MEPHCHSMQLSTYPTMSAQGGPTDWTNHLLILSNRMDKRRKIGVIFFFWWQIWKERIEKILMANNNPRFKFSVTCRSFSFLYKALDINHTNSRHSFCRLDSFAWRLLMLGLGLDCLD
jgi:hypothetical protein